MFNEPVQSLLTFEMSLTGRYLYNDSVDMAIVISNLPSVSGHCGVLIIDVYFALSSSDTNSESSNSVWSPLSMGLDCFLSVSRGNIHS